MAAHDAAGLRRRCAGVIACLASTLLSGAAQAVEPPCPSGWFGARGQIVRVDPIGGQVELLAHDGQQRRIGVDAMVCAGDRISVPDGVRAVEYYESGHTVELGARGSHVFATTMDNVADKASQYVQLAMSSLRVFSAPPPRPAPTSSRGAGDAHGPASPPQAVGPLRDLPRQRLVPDLPVLVGWRDGVAPYACEAVDDSADVVWRGPPVTAAWCSVAPAGKTAVARLLVRDAARRSVGWNVAPATWRDVPRPEWVAADATAASSPADVTAWGIWLWREGGAPWRLQALAMLDAAAPRQWLASAFVDEVMAETPLVATK